MPITIIYGSILYLSHWCIAPWSTPVGLKISLFDFATINVSANLINDALPQLNAFHADAAAVLVRDGQVIAAAEEERFRRIGIGWLPN